jgi:hypothetical protein
MENTQFDRLLLDHLHRNKKVYALVVPQAIVEIKKTFKLKKV